MRFSLKHFSLMPMDSTQGTIELPNFSGIGTRRSFNRTLPETHVGGFATVRRINWEQTFARLQLKFSDYRFHCVHDSADSTQEYIFVPNDRESLDSGARKFVQLIHSPANESTIQGEVVTYPSTEPELRLFLLGQAPINLQGPSRELVHKVWLQDVKELNEVSAHLATVVDKTNFVHAFESKWDTRTSLVSLEPI
jgi:hypothetical protein